MGGSTQGMLATLLALLFFATPLVLVGAIFWRLPRLGVDTRGFGLALSAFVFVLGLLASGGARFLHNPVDWSAVSNPGREFVTVLRAVQSPGRRKNSVRGYLVALKTEQGFIVPNCMTEGTDCFRDVRSHDGEVVRATILTDRNGDAVLASLETLSGEVLIDRETMRVREKEAYESTLQFAAWAAMLGGFGVLTALVMRLARRPMRPDQTIPGGGA